MIVSEAEKEVEGGGGGGAGEEEEEEEEEGRPLPSLSTQPSAPLLATPASPTFLPTATTTTTTATSTSEAMRTEKKITAGSAAAVLVLVLRWVMRVALAPVLIAVVATAVADGQWYGWQQQKVVWQLPPSPMLEFAQQQLQQLLLLVPSSWCANWCVPTLTSTVSFVVTLPHAWSPLAWLRFNLLQVRRETSAPNYVMLIFGSSQFTTQPHSPTDLLTPPPHPFTHSPTNLYFLLCLICNGEKQRGGVWEGPVD
jgi:hypothetical protein